MANSGGDQPRWRTWRAVLLGLLLMPALVVWNFHAEVVFYSFATYAAPFYNVVAILFALTVINLGLRRVAPRVALSQGELIIVYVMLSIQGALTSHNMMEILITLLSHPFRFATPENKWATLFIERLPAWALISNPDVYTDYYLGNSTYWTWEHLRGWVGPAVAWSSFASVLVLVMLCLTILLRRRWIEHERLSYPVLQLPLALINRPAEIFRDRMLWAGFAVAALLSLTAGLHELFPAVPDVPLGRHAMTSYFTSRPWTTLRGMVWSIYPWAIGIGFLIPLDLSFSCWLFYGFILAQRVVGDQFAWNRAGGYPWADDQSFGAYLAILVMGVWVGRQHFARALGAGLRVWRRPVEREDREHRLAVWGAALGMVYLVWFGTRVGIGLGVAVLFFLVYYALAVMITRIRAEMGFPTHDMHHMNPIETFTRLAKPQSFHPSTLVGFTMFYWFNRVWASHPMPHQLEGYKMGEACGARSRPLTIAIALAAVIAPWFLFLIVPHFYYQLGAESARVNQWGTAFGNQAYNQLAGWLQQTREPDPSSALATAAGFAFAMGLGSLRVRLIGWPLHPLAYAIANSWGIQQLWLPLVMASLLKWAMLRAGGLPLYRRWVPFFLGLTLGDFVAGSLWNLAGLALDHHLYDFWPGEIKP